MSDENIIFTKDEKKPRKKREPKIKEPKEPKIKEPKIKEPKIKEPKIKEPKAKKEKPTKTIKVKKTLAQMQREFPQDIIVSVGNTAKCPKGTRKNKEGMCVLTKDFKDTFLKRKMCIQNQRDMLD